MQLKLLTAEQYKEVLQRPGRLFYIYILTNSRGEPFYVGKGARPRPNSPWYYRALAHEKAARSGSDKPVARHIRKLWRAGDEVRYVHHFDSNVEAYVLFEEQVLIGRHGRLDEGGKLVNATAGGQGMYGHKASAQTRHKMSKSRTGRVQTKEHNQAISKGRLVSERVQRAAKAARVPVLAAGKQYSWAREAAEDLGVCVATIWNRIKDKRPGYSYA